MVVHRLRCPTAAGIGLDQELNSNLLRWQVDSLALRATREALISPISRVSKLRLRDAE